MAALAMMAPAMTRMRAVAGRRFQVDKPARKLLAQNVRHRTVEVRLRAVMTSATMIMYDATSNGDDTNGNIGKDDARKKYQSC